ncbi:hypothetical protein DFH06DRAFT_1424157 [Mycena polygramma]|nr:hypothetical protein DFH06DRAFT_1424157 [Mycena polygramma]
MRKSFALGDTRTRGMSRTLALAYDGYSSARGFASPSLRRKLSRMAARVKGTSWAIGESTTLRSIDSTKWALLNTAVQDGSNREYVVDFETCLRDLNERSQSEVIRLISKLHSRRLLLGGLLSRAWIHNVYELGADDSLRRLVGRLVAHWCRWWWLMKGGRADQTRLTRSRGGKHAHTTVCLPDSVAVNTGWAQTECRVACSRKWSGPKSG